MLDTLPPIQKKMYAVLADGRLHRAEELHACLHDDMGPMTNIAAHLTALRKLLRPTGMDILNRREDGVSYYSLVRLLGSPYNG